jgi:hypothetical protein
VRKRNRIVINLDQSPGLSGKRARGGLGKALIIIVVVLALIAGGIAGGGYFWWRRYQRTPAYSLAILADASQRDDQATVDGVMDIDKVTDNLVAQVRQHLTGSYSTLIPADWTAKVDSLAPAVTSRIKEGVRDELRKEVKRLTEPAAGKPLVLVALAINRFASIKEENNVAQAEINIQNEHLQLTMQPDAGRWRIVAVKDDKLAKMIADNVMKNVTAPATALPDELRKHMDKLKKQAK